MHFLSVANVCLFFKRSQCLVEVDSSEWCELGNNIEEPRAKNDGSKLFCIAVCIHHRSQENVYRNDGSGVRRPIRSGGSKSEVFWRQKSGEWSVKNTKETSGKVLGNEEKSVEVREKEKAS